MNQVTESITYFPEEGRNNLGECLRLSFETALQYGLDKVIIFTGFGDGLLEAIDTYLSQESYSHIRLVGVTFAQGLEVRKNGKQIPHVFPIDRKKEFADRGIPMVRAHLPFDSISAQHQRDGVLAQDMGIVGNALNIFCGSMSLCVQAVLMACDAGEVEIGEHVVVMTSDTSLIVRAAPTSRLLTDFIVRQIVCKPAFLTIIKAEKLNLPENVAAEAPTIDLQVSETKRIEKSSEPKNITAITNTTAE
jgi:hypothetical protein